MFSRLHTTGTQLQPVLSVVECTIEALQLQKSCVKIQDFKIHSIRFAKQCNDSHASSSTNDRIISSFLIKAGIKCRYYPAVFSLRHLPHRFDETVKKVKI